jgi:hypothetical protein
MPSDLLPPMYDLLERFARRDHPASIAPNGEKASVR